MGGPIPAAITERDGISGKICNQCKKWLPLAAYSKDRSATYGLRRVCKECAKAYRAPREWHKRWRDEHPEYAQEYRENNKEQIQERHKRWELAHPGYAAAYTKRCETMKDLPGFGYTRPAHIKARWEMWGGRCWICGARATATDHVKPIARGGAHWPCNLRPVCTSCNSSKHARWTPLAWADVRQLLYDTNTLGLPQVLD